MKTQFQKCISFLMALALMVTLLPMTFAEATPQLTTVVITKIGLPSLENWPKGSGTDSYDGSQIKVLSDYFGEEHTLMKGVAFTYTGNLANGNTLASRSPLLTDENGQVVFKNLPPGTYTFTEDKAASTYVGEEGEVLTMQSAVPFTLTLPMARADGSYFGIIEDNPETPNSNEDNRLYVYPKNTDEKPTVEKDFQDSEGDAQRDYDIGDLVPFEIWSTVPQGSEYALLKWSDTMTDGLSYNKDSLWITMNSVSLPEEYYELTQTDRGFVLQLTSKGLAQLKDTAIAGKVSFNLNYNAILNEDAIVKIPEKNYVTMHYGNSPSEGNAPVIVYPKDKEITVTKSWAEDTSPVDITFILYNAQTGEKVEAKTLKPPASSVTFEGLNPTTQYRVVEVYAAGYVPNYDSNGNGEVIIVNSPSKNPEPIEPATPSVITYGKKFKKVDEMSNPLAGAQFIVACGENTSLQYLAIKSSLQQEKELSAYLNAEKEYQDAIVAFNQLPAGASDQDKDTAKALITSKKTARDTAYEAMNMQWEWVKDKDKAFPFVSGEDGILDIKGLKVGSYSLMEIKAPSGYALLTSPISFEVKSQSDSTDSIVTIKNKKVTIPQTGGIGTIIFTTVGILLMALSLLLYKRRRFEETE